MGILEPLNVYLQYLLLLYMVFCRINCNIQTLIHQRGFILQKLLLVHNVYSLGKTFAVLYFRYFLWVLWINNYYLGHFPYYRHRLCTFSTLPQSSSQQLCKVRNFIPVFQITNWSLIGLNYLAKVLRVKVTELGFVMKVILGYLNLISLSSLCIWCALGNEKIPPYISHI